MSRIVIFEDPENRKVLRVSDEVGVEEDFCLGKLCWNCPMNDKTESGCIGNCTRRVLENPHEAGKLMGYRVLAVQENAGEEEKDNSEENRDEVQNVPQNESQKPFLLHYLNVEPEQVFEIEGDEERDYLVNDRGQLMMENKGMRGGWIYAPVTTLYRLLDNPQLVKKKTRVKLEETEIELLKQVLDLVPGIRFMGRSEVTDEVLFWNENQAVVLMMARMGRFPVLDKVEKVDVLEAVRNGWVREKKGN